MPKAVPVPVGWAPELVLNSYWPDADHAREAPTREWFSGGSLAGTQGDMGGGVHHQKMHSEASGKIAVFPTKLCIGDGVVVDCSISSWCTHHGITGPPCPPHIPRSCDWDVKPACMSRKGMLACHYELK